MTRRSSYFQVGEAVGGLVVLGVETRERKMAMTVYRVRYDCCGREAITLHQQITKRKHDGTVNCRVCAQLATSAARRLDVDDEPSLKDLTPRKSLFVDDLPIVARRKGAPSGEYLNAIWDRATAMVRRAG